MVGDVLIPQFWNDFQNLHLLLCLAASPEGGCKPGEDAGCEGLFCKGMAGGPSAGGAEPTVDDDLFRWGEGPMSNLPASQYAANEKSRDWLEADEMTSAASNASGKSSIANDTSNETTMIPYQISQTFRPIHEMDSRFNQSIRLQSCPIRINED